MSDVFAIDPGPCESAWVLTDGARVLAGAIELNEQVITRILEARDDVDFAVEMIASYGMAVGAEVFNTCVWIGRFEERVSILGKVLHRIPRLAVKSHLCHSAKAKDPNVRQALLDRLGPVGTKKAPGPCYGMRTHLWAALGVAVTHLGRGVS